MASRNQLSREEFDRLREKLGVDGEPDYLDELFTQVRGVFMMADSIRAIDVSGAEPDMAFIPPTD
jgi:Asp-tRNA(Asn)/Glu-tRNA(Gln) amidotransferase C subunit